MTTFIHSPRGGIDTTNNPNKRASVVALQLALLITGSLCSVSSVQAFYNIPTATVDPVTFLATPVPSPLCGVPFTATGVKTTNADGSWNAAALSPVE